MQSSEHVGEEEWKAQSKLRGKKKYGIETRYSPTMGFRRIKNIEGVRVYESNWVEEWSRWYSIGWYFKEKNRDAALEHYLNKTPMIFPNGKTLDRKTEYRRVDR